MVSEVPPSRLTTVKGSMDKSHFANILDSKFGAAYDIIFARGRGLKKGVSDVGSADINAVECSIRECYSNTLSRDDAGIG